MLELWSPQKIAFFGFVITSICVLSIMKPKMGYFILTTIIFLRPQDDRPVLSTLHIPLILFISISIGIVVALIKGKIDLKNVLKLPITILYMILVGVMMISSMFAFNPEIAWFAVDDFKFITAFYLFTLILLVEEKDFKYLILLMLLCGLYFAYQLQFKGSSMLESISGTQFTRRNFIRLNSNFGNPNYLAITMVIMFVFAYSQFLYQKVFLKKIPFLIACIIYIYTLINTQSRGGTISLLFVAFMFTVYSKRKVVASLLFVIILNIVLVVLLTYFPSYMERLSTITSYQEDASSTGRLELWGKGMGFIADNPMLGIGLDNFSELTYNSAHNSYIQMASEIGIPGFLIWSMLFYKGWSYSKIAKKYYSKDVEKHKAMHYYSISINISLLACAVQSIFTGMGHREFLFFLIAMGGALYLTIPKSLENGLNPIKVRNVP